METIRVNMTPCEDVQTIHASQNDSEAREWGFILHNNGDVIDSSEITDQMVFKSYEGGTEQILPENGAVPVTAPFVGDIKYPDTTRNDQEFLYRESPTEEDGLANIVDIKGQTLKWNQLLNLTRVEETADGLSVSVNNGTVNIAGTNNTESRASFTLTNNSVWFQVDANDVILYIASNYSGFLYGRVGFTANPNRTSGYISKANIAFSANPRIYVESGETVNISTKFSVFNLTKMFGSAKAEEIYQMEQSSVGSGVAYFRSLFPLDYYPYNSGSLIPFMGNGLKTTGKNLFQNNAVNKTQLGITFTINDDKSITVNGTATGIAYLTHQTGLSAPNIKKGESLILSGSLNLPQSKAYFQLVYKGVSTGTTYSFVSTNASSVSINATEDMTLSGIYFNIASGATVNNMTAYPMLRYADTDSTYEPYTESVINLPISTYFPTGMKQAGNVYDELLPNKATTRIGKVTVDGTNTGIGATALTNVMRITVPIDTAKYNSNQISNNLPFLVSYTSDTEHFYVSDTYIQMFIDKTKCGTTFNSVKQYLSSNPTIIYYELVTPTETSFTTASLVTENTEIPLSNEDGVLIGKCTEQLSAEPGFHDAKIKLSDSDGDVYSNKIQLHVERKPS